jgi:hypothetical protein
VDLVIDWAALKNVTRLWIPEDFAPTFGDSGSAKVDWIFKGMNVKQHPADGSKRTIYELEFVDTVWE